MLRDESGDESWFTSVSEIKLLLTEFVSSQQFKTFSEIFESEVSLVKYLKLISVFLN